MSELIVRRIPWQFGAETTPFQWNPTNPTFGVTCNLISFFAPAFERYIVSVVRDAKDRIPDEATREEAELFLRQEGIHARAHRDHTAALVAQYPGLQETLDRAGDAFDRLLATKPLQFHLAAIANIEATFTPLFKMMFDNEAALFAPGDDRVASLFLWHFAEEIEHRSSALVVYRAVVEGDWYRFRKLPAVLRHVRQVVETICEGFDRHVPQSDRLVSATESITKRPGPADRLRRREAPRDGYPEPYAAVPRAQLRRMTFRLLLSQLPGHQPEDEPLPAFADTWFDAYRRGVDVTRWYESTAGRAD